MNQIQEKVLQRLLDIYEKSKTYMEANKVKREFLCFLFELNPKKEYRHFGDIDAGGFYILEHLKRKTGIPFLSLYMDRKILQIYRESTMPLTTADRKRLHALYDDLQEKIADGTAAEDYGDTLAFMLEKNCKLEQEVVEVLPYL